jgi:hypothetical protein
MQYWQLEWSAPVGQPVNAALLTGPARLTRSGGGRDRGQRAVSPYQRPPPVHAAEAPRLNHEENWHGRTPAQ